MARLATLSQLFDAYAHLQALNTEPRNRTRDEGADDQEQQLSSRFKLSEAALKLCVKRIAEYVAHYAQLIYKITATYMSFSFSSAQRIV